MHAPLPDPLNTPDCTLRGFRWMPLYFEDLFASDFFATATAEELRAALKLWCVAWLQTPAGSLPNSDRALCYHAGLDRNMRAWHRVKEAALHGFILCSDGRLYHAFLVEKAREALGKRESDRKRQAQRRARQREQLIENTQNPSESHADNRVTTCGHHAPVTPDKYKDKDIYKENEQETYPEAQHSRDVEVQTRAPARVAVLNVVQGADVASASVPAPAPAPAPEQPTIDPRRLMPRANDPPYIWVGSGLSRGPDGQPRTTIHKMKTHLVAGPEKNRCMVDYAAQQVAKAALKDPSWRGDWNILVEWLNEGLDLDRHIIPAITETVRKRLDSPKGYPNPNTLRYFSAAIREYAARSRAAA